MTTTIRFNGQQYDIEWRGIDGVVSMGTILTAHKDNVTELVNASEGIRQEFRRLLLEAIAKEYKGEVWR